MQQRFYVTSLPRIRRIGSCHGIDRIRKSVSYVRQRTVIFWLTAYRCSFSPEATRMKRTLSTVALGFTFFAAARALAGEGYVTGNVNLRAGPDTYYPSVAMLGAGTPVAIEGCVDGWSWCDVATGDDRGWVAGNFLQQEYQGQRVMVPAYGVQIGIPVITFMFGTYWDDHYRNRSWYDNREHWSHFSPQYRSVEVHNDSHTNIYVNSQNNSNPRSHEAQATDSHAIVEPGRSAAAKSSYQSKQLNEGKPASVVPPPHPAAKEVQASEKYASHQSPAAPNESKPVVATHTPAEEHTAVQPKVQPKVIAEHKTAAPKAPPKETSDKSPPEHDGGKDKDQH
jgi:uncharacterized protein YraI